VRRPGFLVALIVAAMPQAAAAHDAFGDLGPFYQAFLHPLADPSQALLVTAAAVLLSVQPIASVRLAFVALAVGAGLVLVARMVLPVPEPGPALVALMVTGAAAFGVLSLKPGPAVTSVLAMALGGAAALQVDPPAGGIVTATLILAGGLAGVSFASLFLWGAIDLAARRISPLAPRVAGAWLAAIGIMMAALPS
jgi:urease accessory protein